MIRLLAIPVAGTILALCVVLLAHPAREEEKTPTHEVVPPERPAFPEDDGEEEPPPPPTPLTFHLELQADGSLEDLDLDYAYADVDEVFAELQEVKHTIVLTRAEGVSPAQRQAAADRLGERYAVQGPPAQTYQLELGADGGFRDLETGARYQGLDDLVAKLPDAKHTIVLTNAAGVATSALDAAVTNLSTHYTVRRIERAADR